MDNRFRRRPIYFSIPTGFLIIIVSLTGLLMKGVYSRETNAVVAQGAAQDWFDLLVVAPLLLVTALMVNSGNRPAFFLWLGTMLYVSYNFMIYCFGVHFNAMFLVYCATLGLSFYGIVAVIAGSDLSTIGKWFDERKSNNLMMAYLWVIAILFTFQWLREIIPAIASGDVPQSVKDAGIPTSPVHILDLSFVLPGMVIVAILLRKRNPIGYFFAPAFAVLGGLTGMALVAMVVSTKIAGIPVDVNSAWLFLVMAIISIAILVQFLSHLKSQVQLSHQ